jgi:hypothetical protein
MKRYSDEIIGEAIDRWVVGRFAERNRIILKLRLIDGYTYEQIEEWLYLNDDIRQSYKIKTKQISRVISEWTLVGFDHIKS